jgi:hypothetical protein
MLPFGKLLRNPSSRLRQYEAQVFLKPALNAQHPSLALS